MRRSKRKRFTAPREYTISKRNKIEGLIILTLTIIGYIALGILILTRISW